MYQGLGREKRSPGFFAHHLPVIATRRGDERFSFNLGHKGVGPLPCTEQLDRYLALYPEAMERGRSMGPPGAA